MTEQQKHTVKVLKFRGMSARVIAKETGLTESVVSHFLYRNDLKPGVSHRAADELIYREVV